MNKKLNMAVAGAVLAMGASAANAGITIPAGEWTIDIGGNVNAFYTNTRASGHTVSGGRAIMSSNGIGGTERKANVVQTGLLPSALGIGGKSRQNDLDVGFQFTFFVGADSGNGGAAGGNSLNIRQAFGYFGDKSWGQVKFGRDLGVFGSDAILSDMTLLGVGVGGGHGGSSTFGRIGSGYVYADWVGQIQYSSPNWNGFSFAAAVREPWNNSIAGAAADTTRKDMGFDAKASYEWGGDVSGKVWVGGITQKHQSGKKYTSTGPAIGSWTSVNTNGYRSTGWEIGGKVAMAGAEVVGYYYDGRGLDGQGAFTGFIGNQFGGLQFLNGSKTDDSGGYIQGTYKIPGVGTKLGVSWGENNSDFRGGMGEITNKSWIIGAYHPLTKSLNLVAEYTDQKVEGDKHLNLLDAKYKTLSLGAIMFF